MAFCSFHFAGSIVSNLLVTIGMSGVVLRALAGVKSNRAITICLTWIGVESFAVYLLHQTPLVDQGVLSGNVKLHLFAAVLILIASFPAGWAIIRLYRGLPRQSLAAKGHFRCLALLAGISTVLALIFIQPFMSSDYRQRVFCLMLALVLVVEVYAEHASGAGERSSNVSYSWAVIAASMMQLYVFRRNL
jgi:cytochrome c oxidase assembly factor CtaG